MNVRIALRNEGEMPCCQYTHQLIVLSCRIMAHYHSLTLEHISLSLGLRLDLKAVKSGLLIAT